jgi:hypothetical protein
MFRLSATMLTETKFQEKGTVDDEEDSNCCARGSAILRKLRFRWLSSRQTRIGSRKKLMESIRRETCVGKG